MYQFHYISGYPDGTFRPEEPVSRQNAAVLLWQAMHLYRLDYPSDMFETDAADQKSFPRLLYGGKLGKLFCRSSRHIRMPQRSIRGPFCSGGADYEGTGYSCHSEDDRGGTGVK